MKTSKSCLFGTVNIFLIWRFLTILLGLLKKKSWQKKNFFLKNFFFNFWKSPFLGIIWRDMTKKKFFKKIFFQMQNVSFLVTEIMKFCWKCKSFFVFLKIQACILILFSFFYHFLRFKICNFEFGHRVYWGYSGTEILWAFKICATQKVRPVYRPV